MGAAGTRRKVETLVLGAMVVSFMVVAMACTGEDDATFDTVGSSISSAGGSGSSSESSGSSSGATEAVTSADEPPALDLGSGQEYVSAAVLTVETPDVAAAEDEALAAVEAVGGSLFDGSSDYGESASAMLTFKVPPESLSQVLHDLGELGTVVSQSVDTDDVTADVVDLDSRILTMTESVDRLRELLDGAMTIDGIDERETELMAREAELESLRAQRRSLEGQVDFATIELTLAVDASQLAVADGAGEGGSDTDEPIPGFLEGLSGSWEVFVDVGTVALALVGVLLPWMSLVLVAWLASRAWRRWARRSAPAPVE